MLGLLAGDILAAGSGAALSPRSDGGLAAQATYVGAVFAVSWLDQDEANHPPLVPAAHLPVTLIVSLAGVAVCMSISSRSLVTGLNQVHRVFWLPDLGCVMRARRISPLN